METEFVLEQLRGLAAVEPKLEFIRAAAEKYELPEESAARILAECDLIETRINDKRLKMAVIGEFSSGKSSFINSLLREELLETDVLQGTTVLSVMIYYSDAREITVIENGIRERTVYESAERFRERVRGLNRGVDDNSPISRAEIGLPSEFLKRGICIIDTPGTQSVNAWHDEMTRRIIHKCHCAAAGVALPVCRRQSFRYAAGLHICRDKIRPCKKYGASEADGFYSAKNRVGF